MSSSSNILFYLKLIYFRFLRQIGFKSRIKVGFFVIYANAFSAKPLIDLMLKDEKSDFEPIIIAAPDTMRGHENMLNQIDSVLDLAEKNAWPVVSAYEKEGNEFIDYSNSIDFACIVNPYESMTHMFCTADYLSSKKVKTFFIHYTYSVTNFDKKTYASSHFSNFWKVFISNFMTLDELRLDGVEVNNFDVVGYPKLDEIHDEGIQKRLRKKVILAPHHTFDYAELDLSAWDTFSDIYWRIPRRYPGIDFVFRPHPLWAINLKKYLNWSDSEFNVFLQKITSCSNVTYSTEANYMALFNSSDALIHDCGSFVAEYLYTPKPCCFMMKSSEVYKNFNKIGVIALDLHYHAYTFDDLCKFLEEVVINDFDYMSENRITTAKKYIRIDHPISSLKVLDTIIREHV